MITSYFQKTKKRCNIGNTETPSSSKKLDGKESPLKGILDSSDGKRFVTSTSSSSTATSSSIRSKDAIFVSSEKSIVNTDNHLFHSILSKDTLRIPAQNLLLHLTEESWKRRLMPYTSKSSFTSLAQFVESERRSKPVYPPPEDTFSALNLCPIHKVKVVIVGQDPYHQPNQGHGLAFSVRKGVKIPPSLLNIYKELRNDDNHKTQFPSEKIPTHGSLERWARQGVLLLNTVLTVRANEANSHEKRGWEQFTDEVLRILLKYNEENVDANAGIVFLLWGKPASTKASSIVQKFHKKKHWVFSSSHPSPLGASKTDHPFLGSRCFSRTNEALLKMGADPIHWDVDD